MRIFCQPFEGGTGENLPGMPIMYNYDVEDTSVPDRGTLRQTYEYAVDLLKKSISYHIQDGLFSFTENLTKVYLAKTYFWGGDYVNAAGICNELLAVPEYVLSPRHEYVDMIQQSFDRAGEVIFRDMINDKVEAEYYRNSYHKDALKVRPVGYSLIKLFGSEPEKDVRWGVMCDSKRINTKVLYYKIRVSEFYLMLAECYAHITRAGNMISC